jgi:hypothetical protein
MSTPLTDNGDALLQDQPATEGAVTRIVFMSFGPDGGRIGRWHWRNSGAPDRLVWQQPGWGQFR